MINTAARISDPNIHSFKLAHLVILRHEPIVLNGGQETKL